MAIDRKTRRVAPAWGGLVAILTMAPGLAMAQDRPATGPSTSEPETNKNSPQNPLYGAKPPMAKSPDQVLPGVPASATDPAPPGTRSVRVDLKPGAPSAAARPMANTMTVEGIVTGLSKKGGDLKNETLRITVDPNRGWETFVAGPSAAPAVPPSAIEGSAMPKPINLVLTSKTYTFAHARTADGVDLIGAATESSPDDARLRSEALGSHMTLRRTADQETSWTNIKEGSYVLVRYRKVGELNQAINVSLIQLPLDPNAASVPGALAPTSGSATDKAPKIPETRTPTSPGALPRS